MRCVIVADDLTGAADSSAALAQHGAAVAILPWTEDGGVSLGAALGAGMADVLVIETDSRDLGDVEAGARLALVARTVKARAVRGTLAPLVIKKVDSVLRGPIAAELRALREVLAPARTVLAPAFPRLGRTTSEGVQLRDGVAVGTGPDEAHLPAARRARHADVARACGLGDALRVRAGEPLPEAEVTVHDARTDADLTDLAAALQGWSPEPLVVCSAGLLEALAEHLAPSVASKGARGSARTAGERAPDSDDHGWTLIVSLSPTAAAIGQVAALVLAVDVASVTLAIADAVADPAVAGAVLAADIRTALATGDAPVLVTLDDTSSAAASDEEAARVRAAVLGACRRAFAALPCPSRILANGGDAARTTVDAWRLGRLDVIGPRSHGASAVRSGTTTLVLKSGGFGPPDALIDLARSLAAPAAVAVGATSAGGITP